MYQSKDKLVVSELLLSLYRRFFEGGCPSRAAALAYSTLLSLVPLMLVGLYILSLFPVFRGVGPIVQQFLLKNFVATSATQIELYFNDFLSHLQALSLLNITFLCIVSILLIVNMVGAFNQIWKVSLKRHFALAFLIYSAVLLLTPLILGLLLVVVSSMPLLIKFHAFAVLTQPLSQALPYVSELMVFTLLNWVLPSCRVRFWCAAAAGLITMLLFELAKAGFWLYASMVPTYRLIYGALATIPIFLVWMYVSWLIILFGAVFCSEISRISMKVTLREA